MEALNIAEGFDIAGMGCQTADTYHHLIEAMRLAFADAHRYVADPRKAEVPISGLTSKKYAALRQDSDRPGPGHAIRAIGQPYGSDTVYISCVDGEGNACSFINSVFSNFGSGLVVPDTGIVLQNRASLFSLDPDHPNALEPGKRPYHTIIPAMATKGDEMYLCYGVMGGFMQPQGHMQVISNMVDFGMEPQPALNALRSWLWATRWRWKKGWTKACCPTCKTGGTRLDLPRLQPGGDGRRTGYSAGPGDRGLERRIGASKRRLRRGLVGPVST